MKKTNSPLLFFINFLIRFLPTSRFFNLKRSLYRIAGCQIGKNVRQMSPYYALKGSLIIGENTFIGYSTSIIGGEANVTIGHSCDISSFVRIVTGTHEINTSGVRVAGKGISKDITIGNGVWIGTNSTILPGVAIGDSTVIGAGSVVTKDIPAHCVAFGNPCKVHKFLK